MSTNAIDTMPGAQVAADVKLPPLTITIVDSSLDEVERVCVIYLPRGLKRQCVAPAHATNLQAGILSLSSGGSAGSSCIISLMPRRYPTKERDEVASGSGCIIISLVPRSSHTPPPSTSFRTSTTRSSSRPGRSSTRTSRRCRRGLTAAIPVENPCEESLLQL